jgi:hypothetical protein
MAAQAPTEPPTYAATTSTQRSIQDLRAQILAHGTVLRPRCDVHYGSSDHIELIVAKTPSYTPAAAQAIRSTNFDEKKAIMMREDGVVEYPLMAPPSASSSAVGAHANKHYGVLIRRTTSKKDLYIILRGEPKDTVEEALEWMLERTEMMMHDLVVKNGKVDNVAECVVM